MLKPKNFMEIFDFGFSIGGQGIFDLGLSHVPPIRNFSFVMISRFAPRCDEDGRKLIGFIKQLFESPGRDEPTLAKQFHPQSGFVRLLFNYAQLVDEIWSRPGPASGAVIGRNRSPGPQQLVAQSTPNKVLRQRARQLHNTQSERLCSPFHLYLIHRTSISTLSA
jgi:hypothetical protein